MNFLTPLYLLGALAIVAPIVFHLIRQTPKGEVPFSTIMFLEPSPPRVTSRSRIDHWLLLLLRAGALALLALAFARPFWRAVAQVDPGAGTARRTLILLDTSASMRRGDLWAQARARVEVALAAARPGDPLAILAFDSAPRVVMGFAEAATLEPAARLALARARVAALGPTWRGTELGTALGEAVAAIADGADRDAKAGRVPRRIVLIGDLQSGSKVEALGNIAWPSDVELDLQTVAVAGGNAGIEVLADAEPSTTDPADAGTGPARPDDAGPAVRVRIASDPTARADSYRLGWVDPRGGKLTGEVTASVPPGESRVVRVPLPPVDPRPDPARVAPNTLRLVGDPFPFDDSAYVATAPPAEAVVAFCGPDAPDDPNGLLYYLDRVFESTPRRAVRVAANPAAFDPQAPPGLVVVAGELGVDRVAAVRARVEAGASALVVPTRAGPSPTLAALLGVPTVDWADAPAKQDAMLGTIAFDHPIFAPLAGPQFNDFTKIRFWKHRRVADPARAFAAGQVVARFDDGDPALVEVPVGRGRVVVLASGWAPVDSQLARSSKFVPLMAGLLDRGGNAGEPRRYRVGDRVPLADLGFPAERSGAIEVRPPDGPVVRLEPGAAEFVATDAPGVYTARADGPDNGPPRPFAVNLDPAESRTAPLGREALEQLGARLVGGAGRARLDAEALRQMQTAELEGRQQFWRWLVLGAIAFLIGETWLAGRVDRSRQPRPAAAMGTRAP